MNRRAFFSFLPAAPIGVIMAAEAMANAPPPSMAPDKALMTLTAHKLPPPVESMPYVTPGPPKNPNWGSFTVYDKGDGEWYKSISAKHEVTNFVSSSQSSNIVLGEGMKIDSVPGQFDEETRVAMSVGKDGHLWLKINDEWKRIVTE
jgi:hypothetical protein